jgi:hypothetical protein
VLSSWSTWPRLEVAQHLERGGVQVLQGRERGAQGPALVSPWELNLGVFEVFSWDTLNVLVRARPAATRRAAAALCACALRA